MNFKEVLKKNAKLYALNCKYKAYKTKNLYKKIVNHYERIQKKPLNNIAFKKIKNVFYFGTDEHQDKSGFLQGLSHVYNVKYFTQWDGAYGAYSRKIRNCKKLNSDRLLWLFKELKSEGFVPDLLLMQTWAWRVDVDILQLIKIKYQCTIINIGMDDRHAYTDNGIWTEGTYGLIPALDLVLTCAPECVAWYEKEGVNAVYFPEASHSNFYYPMKNINKIYDVGFIGAKYGVRERIVERLVQNGINVKCFGHGWPSGRLPLQDTNLFFNQCKVILGIGTIGHTDDFYALKLRDFDATMSGSIYLTHNNSDLYSLFDVDKEIFLANNDDEFVELCKELLSLDDVQRQNISLLAARRAVNHHSYDKRFAALDEYLTTGKKISFY